MNMKNDVAFVLIDYLNLYEHQSTYNPNMPLRDLFYISREYEKLVDSKLLYTTTSVKLPTPRFVVFYNGNEKLPLQDAVNRAVEEWIKEDILKDFLTKFRREAIQVSIFEYDEEAVVRVLRQDEREQGIQQGLQLGMQQGKDEKLCQQIQKKLDKNKRIAQIAEECVIISIPLFYGNKYNNYYSKITSFSKNSSKHSIGIGLEYLKP